MTATPEVPSASGSEEAKQMMLAWTPSPSANPAAALRLTTLERAAPAPGEVTVSVAAYSVNRGETFLLEHPPTGWRPGKDVAGTIVRAAEDGSGPKVGTRVVAHPEQGGWAEEVNVAVSRLAVLPESIGFDTAAALPLAGLTALGLLQAVGFLGGQRVLMTGASGGVGHYFTELAAAQGAIVTVVVSSSQRAERLQQLGAAAAVRSASEAVGKFDVVLDSVGGDDFAELWSRLPTRGHLVWFGQASRKPPRLDFLDWRGGSSATLTKFSYADSEHCPGVGLATLVRLVSGGRLHPEIDRVVDWRQTPAVLAALLAREIRGNAVLTVA